MDLTLSRAVYFRCILIHWLGLDYFSFVGVTAVRSINVDEVSLTSFLGTKPQSHCNGGEGLNLKVLNVEAANLTTTWGCDLETQKCDRKSTGS